MLKKKKEINYKLLILYTILILIPIFINYGLLSWSAPGVNTETNPWLTFLGSYLGFMGAISIAILNINKQQRRNEQTDKESRRSYVVVNDFHAPITLHNVKTHENSRLIETENYLAFLSNHTNNQNNINISFIKISHYGNSEVILDCHINVNYRLERTQASHNVDVNIGIVEKGIEVYIPLIMPEIEIEEFIQVDLITIEYKTLMNEKLRYEINHLSNTEYFYTISEDGMPIPLYELDNTSGSTWRYPQKLIKK
jgi:hypothetical protein